MICSHCHVHTALHNNFCHLICLNKHIKALEPPLSTNPSLARIHALCSKAYSMTDFH